MALKNNTLCEVSQDDGSVYVIFTWLLLGILVAFFLFGVGCLVAKRVCQKLKNRYSVIRTRPRGHIYEDVMSICSLKAPPESFIPRDLEAEQSGSAVHGHHHYVNETNQQQISCSGERNSHNDVDIHVDPNGVSGRSDTGMDLCPESSPPCRPRLHRKRRWMSTVTDYVSKCESANKHLYRNVVLSQDTSDTIYLQPITPATTSASQKSPKRYVNVDTETIVTRRSASRSEHCRHGKVKLTGNTNICICKCKCHRRRRWMPKFSHCNPSGHLYCNVILESDAAPNDAFPQQPSSQATAASLDVPMADTNIHTDEGVILLRRQALKSVANLPPTVEDDNHGILRESSGLRNSAARSSLGRKSCETKSRSSTVSSCRASLFSRIFNTSDIPYIDE